MIQNSELKKLSIATIAFLFCFWFLLFYLGANSKHTEKLGQIGDSLNMITSLSGVFTVILLVIAVYLQRSELDAVKQQIKSQTESAAEEQRINRTMKMLEQWSDANRRDMQAVFKAYNNQPYDPDIYSTSDSEYYIKSVIDKSQRFKFAEHFVNLCSDDDIKNNYIHTKKLTNIMKKQFDDDINKAREHIEWYCEHLTTQGEKNSTLLLSYESKLTSIKTILKFLYN